MKKYVCLVSLLMLMMYTPGAYALVTNISLDPVDWEVVPGSQTINSSLSNPSPDMLRIQKSSANPGSGLGAFYQTTDRYDFTDAILQYQWRFNGQGSYGNVSIGPRPWPEGSGVGGRFTSGWSFAGSTLITSNQWYYTQLIIHDDLSYSYDISALGYGEGGFVSSTGSLSSAQYDSLQDGIFRVNIFDNWAANQYVDITDATIESEGGPQGPIPEPATLLLLGSGLLGLGGKRLRRRK
ncbi:MAG: PEP-CTERM sorting domain-containing protein [Candidatus Omnitrophica bacterium]|nr:PEP-CTERM sorting domain-containing protein [Candidatus Omnitrophota bacterium]